MAQFSPLSDPTSIDLLVYCIPYLKRVPTLGLIRSELRFLRLVLHLRSRSLTKALLRTSAGEAPRSYLKSVLTALLLVTHPCVGIGGKLNTGCPV